jgi:hypothetical protein
MFDGFFRGLDEGDNVQGRCQPAGLHIIKLAFLLQAMDDGLPTLLSGGESHTRADDNASRRLVPQSRKPQAR